MSQYRRVQLILMMSAPSPSTREELAAFIRTEIAKWRKVAQSAGISVDYREVP